MPTRPQITPELIAALCQAVSRRAAMVWVYLWSRADRETGKAWPAGPTIAAAVRTNRNHVFEDIAALVTAGWLRVERRAGTSNQYEVIAPVPIGCNRDGTTEVGGSNRDGTGPVTVTGLHPYPTRDGGSNRGGTQTLPITQTGTLRENQSPNGAPSLTAQQFIDQWNSVRGVRRCRKLTKNRRRAFRARTTDPDWLGSVAVALNHVSRSRFCVGDNDRGWRADVDWFLRPDILTKLLEGKYDNSSGNSQPAPTQKGKPVIFRADGTYTYGKS